MSKRARTSTLSPVCVEDVLYDKVMTYDIHTMRASGPTPATLKISHQHNIRLEGGPISLIVLADTSGSMSQGTRMPNLREGLRHLCGLIRNADIDLTIIPFSDDAQIAYGPAPPPSNEKIASLNADLLPRGNTNTGAALRLALMV
jgi:hypothetical protein